MVCPNCKSDRAHRSHRKGVKDRITSLLGWQPYRCGKCGRRFLERRHPLPESAGRVKAIEPEIRITLSTAGKKPKWRELLLWGGAVLLFGAILYYLTRVPSAGN